MQENNLLSTASSSISDEEMDLIPKKSCLVAKSKLFIESTDEFTECEIITPLSSTTVSRI